MYEIADVNGYSRRIVQDFREIKTWIFWRELTTLTPINRHQQWYTHVGGNLVFPEDNQLLCLRIMKITPLDTHFCEHYMSNEMVYGKSSAAIMSLRVFDRKEQSINPKLFGSVWKSVHLQNNTRWEAPVPTIRLTVPRTIGALVSPPFTEYQKKRHSHDNSSETKWWNIMKYWHKSSLILKIIWILHWPPYCLIRRIETRSNNR